MNYAKYGACYAVSSDAGSLLIGNDSWQIMIPNGIGDEYGYVQILDKEPDDINTYEFLTSVHGSFKIMAYDCEEPPFTHDSYACIPEPGSYHIFRRCLTNDIYKFVFVKK